MADKMPEPNANTKRWFQRVPSTPGRTNGSPTKKQAKTAPDDLEKDTLNAVSMANILDEKLDHLAERLEAMVNRKIEDLERRLQKKKEDVGDEIAKVKIELGESITTLKKP